jgi:protein-arginine kinase activator protein McsA
MCEVCGKPAIIHLTEIRDGVKTSRSLCVEHTPPEIRDKLRGAPAEGVAHLRKLMSEADRLIAEIEAGRRRLGDAD